jgi:hypothetical protein
MMGMRYLLLGLFCISFLVSAGISANSGREFTVDDEQIISCDGAIAGAVLQSDVDRVLSSVILLMADAPIPSGGFLVSLYDDSGNDEPGKLLSKLVGSDNPSTAGRYAYSTSTDVVLQASEKYWLVASVKKPGAEYRFQVLSVSSEKESEEVCSSFIRLGDGGPPLSGAPAIFAHFANSSTSLSTASPARFKLLWTLLLSGVILVCCVDLVPFGRFSV